MLLDLRSLVESTGNTFTQALSATLSFVGNIASVYRPVKTAVLSAALSFTGAIKSRWSIKALTASLTPSGKLALAWFYLAALRKATVASPPVFKRFRANFIVSKQTTVPGTFEMALGEIKQITIDISRDLARTDTLSSATVKLISVADGATAIASVPTVLSGQNVMPTIVTEGLSLGETYALNGLVTLGNGNVVAFTLPVINIIL